MESDARVESEADDALATDQVSVLVAHHARFLAFLKPRVGSAEAAEEILQAAFVKGLEKQATIRDGESAVAWFFRLLRSCGETCGCARECRCGNGCRCAKK